MESLSEKAGKLAAIDALAANFGVEVPGALKVAWLDLLRCYPLQQVENAVKAVIRQYEYKTMPPFAVLQAALDDLRGLGEKAFKLQAIAEWAKLYEAISYFGYYSKPKLHPTTEYVLRLLGGWQVACMWNSSELEFRRKEFVRLWMDSHGQLKVMELGAEAVSEYFVTSGTSGSVSIPEASPCCESCSHTYIEDYSGACSGAYPGDHPGDHPGDCSGSCSRNPLGDYSSSGSGSGSGSSPDSSAWLGQNPGLLAMAGENPQAAVAEYPLGFTTFTAMVNGVEE